MARNPFTLQFGKIPASYIQRDSQLDMIADDFNEATPESQIYIIKGVRGS